MKSMPLLNLFSASLFALSVACPLATWAMDLKEEGASSVSQKSSQQISRPPHSGTAAAAAAPAQQAQPDLQFALQAPQGGNGGAAAEPDDQQPGYKIVLAQGRLRREKNGIRIPRNSAAKLPRTLLSTIFTYVCAIPNTSWTPAHEEENLLPWHVELSRIRQVCWEWRDATLTNSFRRPVILNTWSPADSEAISSREEWLPAYTPSLEHVLIAMKQLMILQEQIEVLDQLIPEGLSPEYSIEEHDLEAELENSWHLLAYCCDKLRLPYAFYVRKLLLSNGRGHLT